MIDHVEFTVVAGRGGDGAAMPRREKFVPRGGPDGGDGGRGGNVVLVATRSLSTPATSIKGTCIGPKMGKPGGSNRKKGASGTDIELRVPVGLDRDRPHPGGGSRAPR
ncbi:MAG: hypothetical protein U0360_11555 [Dehalococcoidia bacterium]